MSIRVSNSDTRTQGRVGVFTPSQSWNSSPSFTVTREIAREWRDLGLAEFINKGRGIQLKSVRLPRQRRLTPCRTCGGWSFQTICHRCRVDERVFGSTQVNQL